MNQAGALARRSFRATLRRPAALAPSIGAPLMMLSLFAAGLAPAAKLPGFPARSYFDFALGGAMVQAAIFLGVSCGTSLAADIQTGFFNRLSLTRVGRASLLLGHIAGILAIAVGEIALLLAVGLAFGAPIESGPGGAVVLVLLALLVYLAFCSFFVLLAVRIGSAEVVQGLLMLFFVALTFSSFFIPRNLMKVGWFRAEARWNPLSYLVEGVRSLIITGWDGAALARAAAIAGGITVVSLVAASSVMRSRLAHR